MTSIITTSSSNGVLANNIISAYITIANTYTGTYTGTTLTLSNPSVTVVVVYTPSPTASPTEEVSNKNRLNPTTITIAVILAFLSFLACVGYLVMYRVYHRHFVQKPKTKVIELLNEDGDEADVEDVTIDILHTINNDDGDNDILHTVNNEDGNTDIIHTIDETNNDSIILHTTSGNTENIDSLNVNIKPQLPLSLPSILDTTSLSSYRPCCSFIFSKIEATISKTSID
jgi:hypothetical protein